MWLGFDTQDIGFESRVVVVEEFGYIVWSRGFQVLVSVHEDMTPHENREFVGLMIGHVCALFLGCMTCRTFNLGTKVWGLEGNWPLDSYNT